MTLTLVRMWGICWVSGAVRHEVEAPITKMTDTDRKAELVVTDDMVDRAFAEFSEVAPLEFVAPFYRHVMRKALVAALSQPSRDDASIPQLTP